MSDPTDIAAIATHGGAGLAGAGVVGAFLKWLQGRESVEMATRLALIEQKLDQLVDVGRRGESFGERLALVEQSLKRAHERIDEKGRRR